MANAMLRWMRRLLLAAGARALAPTMLFTVLLTVLLSAVPIAQAAEVLQVRSATLLQVGDHNRTYSVELACLTLPVDDETSAAAWLRQQLPRRTRVNLRPIGNHDGTLLARVARLSNADPAGGLDLSEAMIAAGLAGPLPQCQA